MCVCVLSFPASLPALTPWDCSIREKEKEESQEAGRDGTDGVVPPPHFTERGRVENWTVSRHALHSSLPGMEQALGDSDWNLLVRSM